MYLIRFAEFGAEVKTFAFENTPTVGEVFEKAGKTFSQGCVTVNGNAVHPHTRLTDNQMIVNGKALKGNADYTVTFVRLGGDPPVVQVLAQDGFTVNQAIAGAGETVMNQMIGPGGVHSFEYRVGGTTLIDPTAVIPTPSAGYDGRTPDIRITCTQRLKGNVRNTELNDAEKAGIVSMLLHGKIISINEARKAISKLPSLAFVISDSEDRKAAVEALLFPERKKPLKKK